MPLDLRPTSSSSGAVGSAIVIIGTQAWTSCARFDSPLILPPYPARCPAWGVLRPLSWPLGADCPQTTRTPARARLGPPVPAHTPDPVDPTFHHLSSYRSSGARTSLPHIEDLPSSVPTCLSSLSSPSLSHSKLSRCHVWFLSCQGAPSLIGEEKVNRCVLEFPPQLWP